MSVYDYMRIYITWSVRRRPDRMTRVAISHLVVILIVISHLVALCDRPDDGKSLPNKLYLLKIV
jgi:hypothetical protein